MISDSLNAKSWVDTTTEWRERKASYSRTRGSVIAGAVVFAHALGLYVAIHQSAVTLKLEAGRPAGGSVQVQLVAAPTPRSPESRPTPPKPEKQVAKPMVEKARPVVLSRAPSRRTVEATPAQPVKPVEPTPSPTPVVNPAPASAQPAASAQAAPGPSLLDAPKQIGAGELKQLGCQMPRPEYPAKAKRLEQEGTVVVKLTIGTDGAVTAAGVAQSSGSPLLDAAAVAAISAGHCHPYETAGIAHSVEATQPIAFNLND